MNGQADRCDRTAYVSGLQPTISDIELFEVFNRVAHVEKVIVRNGAARHALIVFKTVQGLYQVLVNFQGTTLHGRQLHIRPLRESSHANSEAISTMFEKVKHQGNSGNSSYRQEHSFPEYRNQNPQASSYLPPNPRGHRNSTGCFNGGGGGYGRRRSAGGYNQYNQNKYPNETYPGMTLFDNHPVQQYSGFNPIDFRFDDYVEGAKRFDNLANLIRSSTPTDPFANYQKPCESTSTSRSRTNSAKDQKHGPPTWKMELQIKKDDHHHAGGGAATTGQKLSPQQFLAQIAQRQQSEQNADEVAKKKRPNLSVINPSLFYEQYPRTSSPVVYASKSKPSGHYDDKIASPHDPAVLAYSRLRVPQSAFDSLSPIDTDNCSFITKHLGPTTGVKRDLTNDELSDMIVSTGNLRINPTNIDHHDEPAPWSPLKRLRAESGSLSTAQVASPEFSPIKPKTMEFHETEDDVFETGPPPTYLSEGNENAEKKCVEQPKINYDDINNSRLPSNSHSAAPNSEKKHFVFPEYPMCRHSSVPSIAHLVGDLSDFCPHATADEKMLLDEASSIIENTTPAVSTAPAAAPGATMLQI